MALEKDRNRRYETANGLAADVRRYLDDEPVQACPPSTWYRFGKFARRNRAALTTSALVVISLVLGIVVSTWQALRASTAERKTAAALAVAESRRKEAEEGRRQARRAVDDMYTQVAQQWLGKQPQMEPLQRDFLQKALGFYTSFAQQASQEPDVRRETALAYRRVGEIQAELHQYPEATAAYRQAIAIQEALAAESPAWSDLRHELAHSHNSLGRLSDTILKTDQAEAEYARAAALFHDLSAARPEHAEYRLDLATVAQNLGLLLSKIDRPQEAQTAFSQAIAQMEQLVAKEPARHDFRQRLAAFSNALGTLLQGTGHPREAEAAFRKTITQMKELLGHRPGSPEDLSVLGGALHNLGRLRLLQGDPTQACPLLREAIVHEQAALAANPRHAGAREYLRNHYWLLANALTRLGDHAEAARAAEEVLRMNPENSMNATIASDLLFDCSEAVRTDQSLREPQRREVAEGYLRRARTLLRSTAELSRERAFMQSGLAWYLSMTPRMSLRDPPLALDLAERAARLEPNNSTGWESLGLARYRNGRWAESLRAFEKVVAIDGDATTMNLLIQAMDYHKLGDAGRAGACYREAISRLSEGGVPLEMKGEIEDLRAEAADLLGLQDLPADVFARP
jgi:tetratricopeptide (TPR) repeat protein